MGTVSYEHHGTTTLFTALSVLDGAELSRCMRWHHRREFIRFLNTTKATIPAGKLVHVIPDDYSTHKHPKVLAWLGQHPCWTFVLH